jgi:hypothetical protein
MVNTEAEKSIESIGIDRLYEHPENPNRMNRASFKKLVEHIRASGNYEPIVVRRYRSGYQILNGHHRVRALAELGYERADCVVWDVDDQQSRVLLATLNRLGGRDMPAPKQMLIERLCESMGVDRLAKQLPVDKSSIRKLCDLGKRPAAAEKPEPLLHSQVFFLDDCQNRIVADRLNQLCRKHSGTAAQKRAKALTSLCRKTERS